MSNPPTYAEFVALKARVDEYEKGLSVDGNDDSTEIDGGEV